MKELTIEEKAKRYDRAIEKARNIVNSINVGLIGKDSFEVVFPELKESEDEKIRKDILAYLKGEFGNGERQLTPYTHEIPKWYTWLEKQGEHVKFRDSIQVGDKVTRNEDGVLVNLSQLNRVAKKDEKQGEQKHTAEEVLIKAGLKPYKDGDQWCVLLGDNIQEGICGFGNTIEDALYAFLKDLIASQNEQKPAEWSEEDEKYLKLAIDNFQMLGNSFLTAWLKSLKERYIWKPSDEQITWLYRAADDASKDSRMKQVLNNLLLDLKKLREE